MSRICLPQHDSPEGRGTRGRLLGVQRSLYDWMHVDGLPPFVKGLPEPEQFSETKHSRMDWDIKGAVLDGVVSGIRLLTSKPDSVSDYDRYYTFMKEPGVAKRWRHDAEFARQRLNGINPFLIRRLKALPAKLPVTQDLVAPVLARQGVTLQQLLDQGRLYIVDFADLADCPKVVGRFQEAAIALFYVDDQVRLMPLAIQLGQDSTRAPVIFTPADEPWLWTMAKAFVSCADGTYHELVSHLTHTHLVMESFWVAASRTLSPTHPLHVLLKPHFMDTIAINYAARNELIVPGGPIDEAIAVGSEGAYWLVDKAWTAWDWSVTDPLADIAARDVGEIPRYWYRDDMKRLYAVLGTYAEELLRVFYKGDDDVKQDPELQAWMAELVSADGARIQGLPLVDGKLARFADLQEIVQRVLWTVSGEHSAVNNGQYDQFGYIPNTPGAMWLPAPRDRSPLTEGTFAYALPPELAVDQQLTLVHLLSMPTTHPLGRYPDGFYQDVPAAQAAVDRFRARLDRVTIEIRDRNRELEVPYVYLDPATVSRSIAI